MIFRQSSLKVWQTCPLMARFKQVERVPEKQSGKQSFGTVIHYVLEAYSNGTNVDACIDMFKLYWGEPERLGVKPEYWPRYTTYGALREKGIEILRQYHDKAKWENRTVIAAEHRFLVPFGEHQLQGSVDLVELKKSGNGKPTLRIVDWKTVSKQPTSATLRLDIQFSVYMYACLQPEFWMGNGEDYPGIPDGERLYKEFLDVPRRGVWYHLMTNKELDAGTRDDGDFMRLYRLAQEIANAIKKEVFVPNISGESCVYCQYTQNCNIEIPDRDFLDEDGL